MPEDERSSRNRMRAAARTLFAERGYEATAIAEITHAARTSHSQFLKYYSGKEELRRELIEQHWAELSKSVILAISSVPSATDKLKLALNMLITSLESDRELRTILLLEQTAIRDQGIVKVGQEFQEFVAILNNMLEAMRDSGQLAAGVDLQTFGSALIGSVEGMMRNQLLSGSNSPKVEEVRSILARLVDSVLDVQRPLASPQRRVSDAVPGLPAEDDWIRYYLKLADKALISTELS